MPQPKKKHTNMRTGHRRSHWMNSIEIPNLSTCPTCRAPKLPHTLCQSCRTYNGRQYGVSASEG